MDWQSVTPHSHDLKRDFALAGLLVLAGAGFFLAVNAALMTQGVDSLESLYFSHRAVLAFTRENFSIRDVIELRSPLTHAVFLILRNPAVAASVIGGSFLSVLILLGVGRMRAGHFSRVDQTLAVGALIMSPSLLALGAMEPGDCFRMFLALCAYGLLFFYNERGYSLHLFSFCILCAMMLYTGDLAIYFCVAMLPFVVVTALRKKVPTPILVLVYITPLFFIMGSISFLHMVFNEGVVSLADLQARFLDTLTSEAVRGNIVSSMGQTLAQCLKHPLAFAPLAASMAVSFARWRQIRELYVFLALWPFIELFGEMHSGGYRDFSLTALVVVLSSLLMLRIPGKGVARQAGRLVFMLAMGIWLWQGWSIALDGPPAPPNLVARVALGETPPSDTEPYRALARRLAGEQGRVLMDNGQLYPLVSFMESPERFILPHHPGFEAAVSSPGPFACFVVVKKGDIHDQFLKKHPSAGDGVLDGYVLMFRQGDVLAFERQY
jgi:hypothetical protein